MCGTSPGFSAWVLPALFQYSTRCGLSSTKGKSKFIQLIGSGYVTRVGRAASLAIAAIVSLILTLDPYILRTASTFRVHTGLPLLMLGVSVAFAHGLGFQSASRLSRALLHPVTGWTLLMAGASLIGSG